MPKLLHWGFCLYFSVLRSTSVLSSVGFKISAQVRQSSMTSTHCGQAWISLGKSLYKDILFLCPQWSSGPYISRNFLKGTNFVNTDLEKIGPMQAHFQYSARKLMLSLKVRFTMMYSLRKLNNKVITTACNFWRQIACSFQVYGCTNHHNFCTKSTRKNTVLNFPLFSPDQHWRHKLFLPTIFRLLYEDKGQKITIFNYEYLEDACFNWAETS